MFLSFRRPQVGEILIITGRPTVIASPEPVEGRGDLCLCLFLPPRITLSSRALNLSKGVAISALFISASSYYPVIACPERVEGCGDPFLPPKIFLSFRRPQVGEILIITARLPVIASPEPVEGRGDLCLFLSP